MITLIPTSGLSNRMRAIDSALAICEKYQIEIKIIWVRDSDLNCPFSKLFKSLELAGTNLYDLPLLFCRYSVLFN